MTSRAAQTYEQLRYVNLLYVDLREKVIFYILMVFKSPRAAKTMLAGRMLLVKHVFGTTEIDEAEKSKSVSLFIRC